MATALIKGHKLADAESLAASFTLTEYVTNSTLDSITFSIDCSGITDNSGEFFIDHRIYVDDNRTSAWSSLTLTPQAVLADADDVLTVLISPAPPGQYRVRFTAAGVTPDGAATIWVAGSSQGGR